MDRYCRMLLPITVTGVSLRLITTRIINIPLKPFPILILQQVTTPLISGGRLYTNLLTDLILLLQVLAGMNISIAFRTQPTCWSTALTLALATPEAESPVEATAALASLHYENQTTVMHFL